MRRRFTALAAHAEVPQIRGVVVRKDAKIRQQTLAKILGPPQSFVAKYENGERRIGMVEFIAIVRALDADPSSCSGVRG
jgi:predicted transcriptional regulator